MDRRKTVLLFAVLAVILAGLLMVSTLLDKNRGTVPDESSSTAVSESTSATEKPLEDIENGLGWG